MQRNPNRNFKKIRSGNWFRRAGKEIVTTNESSKEEKHEWMCWNEEATPPQQTSWTVQLEKINQKIFSYLHRRDWSPVNYFSVFYSVSPSPQTAFPFEFFTANPNLFTTCCWYIFIINLGVSCYPGLELGDLPFTFPFVSSFYPHLSLSLSLLASILFFHICSFLFPRPVVDQ